MQLKPLTFIDMAISGREESIVVEQERKYIVTLDYIYGLIR